MTPELRRKANEAFQAAMAEYAPPDKSPLADAHAQQFAGIDLSGNFCQVAPDAVQGLIHEIKLFAWAIPDKIEKPGLAVLHGFLIILPEFCGDDTVAPDDLRRKAHDEFKSVLRQLQGEPDAPKSPLADMRAQQFAGITLGENFCTVAPRVVQGLIDEIDMFSMVIPDKIERPGVAVLKAFLIILPEFCNADASDGVKKTAASQPVKKNFK